MHTMSKFVAHVSGEAEADGPGGSGRDQQYLELQRQLRDCREDAKKLMEYTLASATV